MLQIVGRERQGGVQVFLRELGVRLQDIRERSAGPQLAQDQLHGDARALNTRLAHHDGGIGGNTTVWHRGYALRVVPGASRMVADKSALTKMAAEVTAVMVRLAPLHAAVYPARGRPRARPWLDMTPVRRVRRSLAAVAGRGDVKALQGRKGYRLRVGAYRVIFDEDATTILAIHIGRRTTTTYTRS